MKAEGRRKTKTTPRLRRTPPQEGNFITGYKRQARVVGIVAVIAAVVGILAGVLRNENYPLMRALLLDSGLRQNDDKSEERKGKEFGEFMAGLHAIQISDFAGMKRFSEAMSDSNSKLVRETVMRAAFMSGGDLVGGHPGTGEATLVKLSIDFALAAKENRWKDAWKIVRAKDIFLLAPARIVAAVAAGQPEFAHKIADSNKAFPDLVNFYHGFAHAVQGQPKSAKKYFDLMSDDFLNLNDFLFIRAFYLHHKMDEAAAALTERFAANPRGSFIADIADLPDWSNYDTYQKQVRFGLVSVVAHNPFMVGTGWGLVALRTAEAVALGEADDALNYYLGMNFAGTGHGDFFFDRISEASPFRPFVMAQGGASARVLEKLVKKYPSFTPAVGRLALLRIADGDLRGALKTIDRALDHAKDASPSTTVYLLKIRAHINLLAGELFEAENDLNEASLLMPKDHGLIADKARVWAAQGRALDQAYDLMVSLIKENPGVSDYWDAIGVVLNARGEGAEAAKIFERVQRIEPDVSSYAEHAGDAYSAIGEVRRAKDAYRRALDLKADGQINAREVRKKMNRLK
ncbi:MAG: tetratricopeptide repeat protein [Rickettsiales bacterium]|jgi:Flp pilus assembly protein TadD|nr:tetratricopeptide repeat protein [Rickettsiales bacterium]